MSDMTPTFPKPKGPDGSPGEPRLSRRQTLAWFSAAMATPILGSCGDDDLLSNLEDGDGGFAPWLHLPNRNPAARGYGRYPNMVVPSRPWPLTMTPTEKQRTALLIDAIMPADEMGPAASDLGVAEFIDEWISAPYPNQRRDGGLITSGLRWLGDEGKRRYGRPFETLNASDRAEFVSILNSASLAPGQAEEGLKRPGLFFRRMKYLTTGAYFTTEEGNRALGYVGNVAIGGDWPGPSEEALDHLRSQLAELGLKMPRQPGSWRNG